jgi:hypothetical protein
MMQVSCDTIGLWQWIGASFAALSAGLWIAASLVKTPPAPVTFLSIDQLATALKRQGRLNAGAAVSAAVAASIQAFLILTPTCIHFS